MRRNIVVEDGIEEEGLCYDLTRAREEGLSEELRAFVTSGVYGDELGTQTHEVNHLTDEDMEALIKILDFGVNVGPGGVQEVTLTLKYKYDYGTAEVLAAA